MTSLGAADAGVTGGSPPAMPPLAAAAGGWDRRMDWCGGGRGGGVANVPPLLFSTRVNGPADQRGDIFVRPVKP